MESHSKEKAPNLFLVGFMGTGKSAVGRRIAQMLDYPFMDSDHEIEAKENMRIPEIFERFGEAHFRQMEREFVDREMPRSGHVISCGGGLVTQEHCLNAIKSNGIVVVLYANFETIFKRISHDKNRPLMQVDDPRAEIQKLLEQRESTYRNAGVGIMTDGHTISEVAEHAIRIYSEKTR